MMSLLFAPMALRTPISRVRSVTLTSMMFITPTPPINRPIALRTTVAIATLPTMLWNSLICSSAVATEKLSLPS